MKKFRTNIAGVSPWEDIVGYSRIVIIGDQVEVAGSDDGGSGFAH